MIDQLVKWKVVNYLTGWESPARYETYVEANQEISRLMPNRYRESGKALTIVPENYEFFRGKDQSNPKWQRK